MFHTAMQGMNLTFLWEMCMHLCTFVFLWRHIVQMYDSLGNKKQNSRSWLFIFHYEDLVLEVMAKIIVTLQGINVNYCNWLKDKCMREPLHERNSLEGERNNKKPQKQTARFWVTSAFYYSLIKHGNSRVIRWKQGRIDVEITSYYQ